MTTKSQWARLRGFSLVELLVAILVSMILMLIVMKLFADSESAKRNVSSGGAAQSNGALAIYSLGRELRFAGFGFTADAALGCTLNSHNTARNPVDLAINLLSPVRVFPAGAPANLGGMVLPAGDAGSNTILLAYGNSSALGDPVGFNDLIASKNGYALKSRVGFQVGDFVLAAQGIQQPCSMMQVTALPGTVDICGQSDSGDADLVRIGTASFLSPYNNTGSGGCVTAPPTFNSAVPTVSYPSSGYAATLSNLGSSPRVVAYTVRNGNLVSCDVLTTNCANAALWTNLVSNIVGLQAQYGRDTSGTPDGSVDIFSGAAANFDPADRCQISRIAAVRIGVLARNALAEKVDAAGNHITPNAPTWSGGVFALPAGGNDFRYKVFETVVPLRNMVWRGPTTGC